MKFSRLFTICAITTLVTLIGASSVFAKSPAQSALNIAYQATVVKDIADTTNGIAKVFVNMYKIKIVNNEYKGTLVKTLSTGKDGYQAVFKIKPGEMVDFLAFKTKALAQKSKNKKHTFEVPPFKNFSVAGKPMELCHTAGVLTEQKLTNPDTGDTFCIEGENGYMQGYMELSK